MNQVRSSYELEINQYKTQIQQVRINFDSRELQDLKVQLQKKQEEISLLKAQLEQSEQRYITLQQSYQTIQITMNELKSNDSSEILKCEIKRLQKTVSFRAIVLDHRAKERNRSSADPANGQPVALEALRGPAEADRALQVSVRAEEHGAARVHLRDSVQQHEAAAFGDEPAGGPVRVVGGAQEVYKFDGANAGLLVEQLRAANRARAGAEIHDQHVCGGRERGEDVGDVHAEIGAACGADAGGELKIRDELLQLPRHEHAEPGARGGSVEAGTMR